MRKALVIGIDHYDKISGLTGCVNDAQSVRAALERHADGTVNFHVMTMVCSSPTSLLPRAKLKDAIKELFAGDPETALLYFAGHGHSEATGGYLCASDCERGDDGVPLAEIMTLASQSKAQNRIVILDSCHSGIAGDHPQNPEVSELKNGMTILTASTAEQYASEENGSGIFTSLMIDALSGAAANLVGDITPGSVYAHIDQSLGGWAQRPVFKTNVTGFVSLRKATPPLELADLQRIDEFFPAPGFHFQLDPTYEPERDAASADQFPAPDPEHTAIFAILQKYNRLNLLVPEGAPHMWHAAMESKTVRLTVLGEHYRRLRAKGLI